MSNTKNTTVVRHEGLHATPNFGSDNASDRPGTIHNLPTEILLQIFRFVQKRRRIHWTFLMLVCRFWRELAVESPSLWQSISVHTDIKQLALGLVRSRNSPLDVHFYSTCQRIAPAAVSELLLHAQRLRTLILPPMKDAYAESHREVRANTAVFRPLLCTAMPALETLKIPVPELLRPRFDLAITSRGPAPLRVLRLSCVSFPWHAALLSSSLTRLELRACVASGTPLSCDQFLDVLGACVRLERLRLWDSFVSTALENWAPDTPRAISLSKLYKLDLADEPRVIAWLLSCLTFAATESVDIVGVLPRAEDNEEFPVGVFSSLAAPGIWTRLFPTTAPTNGEIYTLLYTTEITVWSSDETAKLHLQLSSSTLPDMWEVYLAEAIQSFHVLFDGLPLLELAVHGDLQFAQSHQLWGDLLYGLPELRKLTIDGRGYPTPLLRVLKSARPLPGTVVGAANCGSRPRMPPPCGQLREVLLENPDYETGNIELLLAVLHRRAHFRLAPMDRVVLYLWTEENEDEFYEEMDAYLSELKELCPDIVY